MKRYWELNRASKMSVDSSSPHPPPPSSSPVPPSSKTTNDDSSDDDEDLEDAYDRTRRALLETAAEEDEEDWSMEYARYLKDLARDVDRDTDLVDWWFVSQIYPCYKSITNIDLTEELEEIPHPRTHRARRAACASVVRRVRAAFLSR